MPRRLRVEPEEVGSAPAPIGAGTRDLHIYVHWPFCVSKCPYCDFNSFVARDPEHARWQRALIRELTSFAEEAGGATVGTIYFGGGTPSLMPPQTIGAVIDATARLWPLAPDAEVTLEVNPTTAEAGRFRGFRSAGVNRLSVGVQAMSDPLLQFLGRTHTAAEARQALSMAHNCFDRVSMDLIYGLPDQGISDWRQQLAAGLAVAGEHLSVYQLTVEPGTLFFRRRVPMADEETAEALWETTADMLAQQEYEAYEVSNHARPAGACRHNLAVWQGADYLGVGPGAHGRLTTGRGVIATCGLQDPMKWLRAAETAGGATRRTPVSPRERATELVLMGLRLSSGIDALRFRQRASVVLEDVIDPAALAQVVELGDVEADKDGLRATRQGLLRLDAVLGALLC